MSINIWAVFGPSVTEAYRLSDPPNYNGNMDEKTYNYMSSMVDLSGAQNQYATQTVNGLNPFTLYSMNFASEEEAATAVAYLLDKWRKYGAHHIAFAPENPLGQWRNMIQELYDIELKIPDANKR